MEDTCSDNQMGNGINVVPSDHLQYRKSSFECTERSFDNHSR